MIQRSRVERLTKSDYILFCIFVFYCLIRVNAIEGCLNGKNLPKIKRQAHKTVKLASAKSRNNDQLELSPCLVCRRHVCFQFLFFSF